MAILKKGILGTPKGIIANYNCYNRKGKGIIQSRAKVKDSYSRYWNLLEYRLTLTLDYFWSIMPTWQTNKWNSIAPPGLTGKEYYLTLNLEYAKENEQYDQNNLTQYRQAVAEVVKFDTQIKYANRQMILTIDNEDPFLNRTPPLDVEIRVYKFNGSSNNFTHSISTPNPEPIVFDFQTWFGVQQEWISVIFNAPAEGWNSSIFFTRFLKDKQY